MKKLNITPESTEKECVTTQKNKKLNLLEHIEQIVELSKESGLKTDFFVKAKKHIKYVNKVLNLNDIQTIFLSHFADRSDDKNILISEIAKFINCRNIKLLQFMDDIDVLEKRRFVRCSRDGDHISYRVPREVITALRENREFVPLKKGNLSIEVFFDELDKLFDECKENELTYSDLKDDIEVLMKDNAHLEFCAKMKEVFEDKILLLVFFNLFVRDSDDDIRFSDFSDIFERHYFSYIKRSLKEKENQLFNLELIENTHDDGFEERESFKLTDKAKENFLSELNIIEKQAKNKKDIIRCDTLTEKKMYYNEKERSQIEQLTKLLREENFKDVKQRLKDKGMRTGFASLFHGAPGTGKTESVYQIARQTGRDIMLVDISQTKSMWFGESEKKIKEIFERYRCLVKSSKIAPILLFNEADAVIGKRKDVTSGNVAQTENAIQNIILQEMENLEGIMIATTNLTKNLDKAFERRFLYKIEFEKPNTEAKANIWQSIIPALSGENANVLAARFDFSGGQIENIARKSTVDSIILGHEPDFTAIETHCTNEKLEKEQRKIGFVLPAQ